MIQDKFKDLRKRAHLSRAALAEMVGFGGASSIQRYETVFTKRYISVELAEKLAKVMVGRGQPPITGTEVFALAGIDPKEKKSDPSYASDSLRHEEANLETVSVAARIAYKILQDQKAKMDPNRFGELTVAITRVLKDHPDYEQDKILNLIQAVLDIGIQKT